MALTARIQGVSCAACLLVLLASASVRAAPSRVEPWELLGDDLGAIYGFPNLALFLTAAAVTPPLVLAADEPVQRYFQRSNPLGSGFATGALIIGGSAPAALPLALYFGGL